MLNLYNYINEHSKLINTEKNIIKIRESYKILKTVKKKNKKLILLGNGGSAATASHLVVDFTKQAKIKSINFNESSLITAFANDYGFEQWLGKALEFYSEKGDVVILISVSGESMNLKNALKFCKKNKIKTIGLSGKKQTNFLNKNSDVGIHIQSNAYNIVENSHAIILTYLVDSIIGKMTYSVK